MSNENNGSPKSQQNTPSQSTYNMGDTGSNSNIINTSTTFSNSNSSISSLSTKFENLVLHLDFKSTDVIHQWERMLKIDEFVGARRNKHTVVAYKEAIYAFGGDSGKNVLNDLIRFDIKEESWGRAFATGVPPAPRYHHSAVVYGSSMFIFGGYTGDIYSNLNLENKNDLFEYKFQNGQWLEWQYVGRAPVPRSAHGAAVYDNKLWIFAGYDGNARLNDMWAIPLNSNIKEWEEIEQRGDRPPTCCNFAVAVARDCMYVFSGQSGLQITNALFEFNFKTKAWRRISNENILRATPPPPARRYGHIMVQHDHFLYVFGGSADNTLPNDLHKYDLDSQTWSVIVPEAYSEVPVGRVFHAAAVIGEAMYIFGGTCENNVRSGDMFRFQFSSYPQCTLHDDFGKLLTERQFCDVQFIVGKEEHKILAHIAIIAARSNYLKDKIMHAKNTATENSEKILEVRLPGAAPDAFEMVLNYIYTDRISFHDEITTNIVMLMMDIYQLAVQISIPRLEQLCLQYLKFIILKTNVLDALQKADKLNLSVIKDYCLQFIVKDEHYNDIIMSDDFPFIEKSIMIDIVRKRFNPVKNIETKYEKLVGTTLESDMGLFLTKTGKEFCDVNLILDDNIIPSHKIILSARCSYFQALFRSFMPPDNAVTIKIGDFTPSMSAFYSLLRYIYYGETLMRTEDSLYLFHPSSYYGFTNNRLHAYCKHNLENNIHVGNVLEILQVADKMNVPDIKNYALRLIVKEFSQIGIPRLHTLNRDLLLDLIITLSNAYDDHRKQIEKKNSGGTDNN